MQEGKELAKECAIANGLTEEEGIKIREDPKANLNDENAQVVFCKFDLELIIISCISGNSIIGVKNILQKLIKCILSKWNLLDDKGNFKEDVAIDVLSKGEERAKYEEIAQKCKSAADGNTDEMPIHVYACYTELMHEQFIYDLMLTGSIKIVD